MFGSSAINSDSTMQGYVQNDPYKALKNIKDVLSAYKYMQITEINNFLVDQSTRVGNMFDAQETYLASIAVPAPRNAGNLDTYVPIGLGNMWRQWVRGRVTL